MTVQSNSEANKGKKVTVFYDNKNMEFVLAIGIKKRPSKISPQKGMNFVTVANSKCQYNEYYIV